MGNQNSLLNDNSKKNMGDCIKFLKEIDRIAIKYIFTHEVNKLKNLENKEYCSRLIHLTSDILEEKFNIREIECIYQRIKYGIEPKLNVKKRQNNTEEELTKKKILSTTIAQFYIKLAHVYSCIMMTLNPIYKNDEVSENNGINNFKNKLFLPKGCQKSNLLKNIKPQSDISEQLRIEIEPYTKQSFNSKNRENDMINKTNDEAELFELKSLYYDKYNFNTCRYNGMSDSIHNKYLNDVKEFYREFSGESIIPNGIISFSEIKLCDFNNSKIDNIRPNKNISFTLLAKKMKESIQNTNKFREKILYILDEMFYSNRDNNNNTIKINPTLTIDQLSKLIDLARETIVEIYINSEKDSSDIVRLYEAIIEKQIKQTNELRQINLERQLKEVLLSE
jgi:hypothetical protein